MAKRICQKCNGKGSVPVRDNRGKIIGWVVCDWCGGTGEEEIRL